MQIVDILFAFLLRGIIFILATISCISSPESKSENSSPPQTFMHFFESFMWDEKLQKSRIIFPIEVDGKTIEDSTSWQHLPFYANNDFIPIIHTDTVSWYDQHVPSKEVQMSIISFEDESTRNYFFEKREKDWFLINIDQQHLTMSTDISFLHFIREFSRDSLYQIQHIRFPLPDYKVDPMNDYAFVYDTTEANEWRFFDLAAEIEGAMNLNTGIESEIRDIFYRGVENGIFIHLIFMKKESEWMLVKAEDYST